MRLYFKEWRYTYKVYATIYCVRLKILLSSMILAVAFADTTTIVGYGREFVRLASYST